MKYKVGDIVLIRDDLQFGEHHAGFRSLSSAVINSLNGKILEISGVYIDHYGVVGCGYAVGDELIKGYAWEYNRQYWLDAFADKKILIPDDKKEHFAEVADRLELRWADGSMVTNPSNIMCYVTQTSLSRGFKHGYLQHDIVWGEDVQVEKKDKKEYDIKTFADLDASDRDFWDNYHVEFPSLEVALEFIRRSDLNDLDFGWDDFPQNLVVADKELQYYYSYASKRTKYFGDLEVGDDYVSPMAKKFAEVLTSREHYKIGGEMFSNNESNVRYVSVHNEPLTDFIKKNLEDITIEKFSPREFKFPWDEKYLKSAEFVADLNNRLLEDDLWLSKEAKAEVTKYQTKKYEFWKDFLDNNPKLEKIDDFTYKFNIDVKADSRDENERIAIFQDIHSDLHGGLRVSNFSNVRDVQDFGKKVYQIIKLLIYRYVTSTTEATNFNGKELLLGSGSRGYTEVVSRLILEVREEIKGRGRAQFISKIMSTAKPIKYIKNIIATLSETEIDGEMVEKIDRLIATFDRYLQEVFNGRSEEVLLTIAIEDMLYCSVGTAGGWRSCYAIHDGEYRHSAYYTATHPMSAMLMSVNKHNKKRWRVFIAKDDLNNVMFGTVYPNGGRKLRGELSKVINNIDVEDIHDYRRVYHNHKLTDRDGVYNDFAYHSYIAPIGGFGGSLLEEYYYQHNPKGCINGDTDYDDDDYDEDRGKSILTIPRYTRVKGEVK